MLWFFFQVKINGQNEEMLRAAIEQFGDKTEDEISYGMSNLFLNSWVIFQK